MADRDTGTDGAEVDKAAAPGSEARPAAEEAVPQDAAAAVPEEIVDYDYSAVESRISQLGAEADFKRMLGRTMIIGASCMGAAIIFLSAGYGWWIANRDRSSAPVEMAAAAPAPMTEAPPAPSASPPTIIEREGDSGVVTTNFTIFRTVEVQTNLGELRVKAGHHFDTEDQTTFSYAWCYADIGGTVSTTVNLANKVPGADPEPIKLEAGDLERTDLDPASHRRMVNACPWLDSNPNISPDASGASTIGSVGPAGRNVLRLRGEITPESVDALVARLTPETRVLELDSPGGQVDAALRAYALVRERGVETRVIENCASACALVFIGGAKRSIGPAGRIGVHQWVSNSATLSEAEAQTMSARLLRVTIEAGVSPEFFIAASETPHEDVRWVSGEELDAWGLVTH